MFENLLTILLIEDDIRLATLTRQYLERHNAVVTHVTDGLLGLEEALRNQFDIILLDLMLPGMDGISICQKIRERKDVPIIMLTARGEEADKVMGLELGADDYLSKPFSPRELLARIRAAVRRYKGHVGPKIHMLKRGDLLLDPGARIATYKGTPLDLTSYEFAILHALAENAGRVLSRDRLMDLAKGNSEESFDRSIDVHVSRLRKKLGDNSRDPNFIRTVRGVGYLYLSPS